MSVFEVESNFLHNRNQSPVFDPEFDFRNIKRI